jgi:hypothetical protein
MMDADGDAARFLIHLHNSQGSQVCFFVVSIFHPNIIQQDEDVLRIASPTHETSTHDTATHETHETATHETHEGAQEVPTCAPPTSKDIEEYLQPNYPIDIDFDLELSKYFTTSNNFL